MALSILDGNQSATTLSTILSSGQHITAHTVVSLGTQAITDMRSAVSGSVVSISNLPATQTVAGTVTIGNSISIESGNITIEEAFGENSFMPISGTVTIGSALPAGTNQIGAVTANTFAVQGTAVTTSNFTSITPSTVLASFNATREVLTIFNEGAGNLHICAGATCTTIAYQVRLSAGDYYEVPNHQTSLTHSAVFATAGTARVCQVS
jgi:hypothetical protein